MAEKSAIDVLHEYFDAMFEWMKAVNKRRGLCNRGDFTREEEMRLNNEHLMEVHQRFAPGVRVENYWGHQWPSPYDGRRVPRQFTVIQEDEKQQIIQVCIDEHGFEQFRFEVKKLEGEWKLTKMMRATSDGTRWAKMVFRNF